MRARWCRKDHLRQAPGARGLDAFVVRGGVLGSRNHDDALRRRGRRGGSRPEGALAAPRRARNDVVLDFGFWFRRQRDEFRALLAPQGIVPETVYIATDLETILSRVGDRHGRQADDWPLTVQTATEYFERFEPPTPEEGPLEIIR
nr:AAA family ATPase [Agromyces sp. H66]